MAAAKVQDQENLEDQENLIEIAQEEGKYILSDLDLKI